MESHAGGLEKSDVKRLNELEYEKSLLKWMIADLLLESAALAGYVAGRRPARLKSRNSSLESLLDSPYLFGFHSEVFSQYQSD